jgi:hypothetical protein
MTGSVVATAARALVSSGLLSPPSLVAGFRLIREARRGGTNPYTLFGGLGGSVAKPGSDNR